MKRKIFSSCYILLLMLLSPFIAGAQIQNQTVPQASVEEKKNAVNQCTSAAISHVSGPEVSVYYDLENFLNSTYYQGLPDDSVYAPQMAMVSLNDPRVSHLLGNNGQPVNPLKPSQYPAKFKDGGPSLNSYALVPDHIDFVQIEFKVYYRLFFSPAALAGFFPQQYIDFSTYPGFLLLEIKRDIHEIASDYLTGGADSVQIINDNCIKVFKQKNNLNLQKSQEAYQAANVNYPGYFKFVRAENALYLPLKTKYPDPTKEVKARRTTNSRHFKKNNGSIEAHFSMRPTSYPILPAGMHININDIPDNLKNKIKWIELPACYPVPSMKPATKATYVTYFDETFYGHSVYCTNDASAPYVWICAPGDGYFLGTVGALSDDDFWSGEEYNYERIHDKFDITSIQDGSDITAAEYETYLPDVAPYVTGDCDGTISWEEVRPEIKDMVNNMTSANNPQPNGNVDFYSWTWYDDVEYGTVYYLASGWPWDRGNGYTGYDCDFNASGLSDVESMLASNWYVVGVSDEDENNQSPTYWEAVATYNFYSNLRISYTPCCIVPTSVTAYANGAASASICTGVSFPLTVGSSTGGGCYCGTWQYAWSNGTNWWNGTSFGSASPVYDASYSTINTSATATTTYTLRMRCSSTVCSNSYTSDDVAVTIYTESSAASSISGDNSICPGTSTTLTLSGGSLGTGATWRWYAGSCGGTSIGSGTSITVSPTANTTYYVRAEGTCNITTCVSYTVNLETLSTAATSASASPSSINSGQSSTLSMTGGSLGTGAQWVWYSGSCGGTQVGTGTSITVNPTANTTYYVRAVGNCNTTQCVSVTVLVTGTFTICRATGNNDTQWGIRRNRRCFQVVCRWLWIRFCSFYRFTICGISYHHHYLLCQKGRYLQQYRLCQCSGNCKYFVHGSHFG